MGKAKYIKTKGNDIIVFGEQMMHSDFKHKKNNEKLDKKDLR